MKVTDREDKKGTKENWKKEGKRSNEKERERKKENDSRDTNNSWAKNKNMKPDEQK